MDLSTNDARLALVGKYATKYGLDPAIVAAVCEQESGWNPFAVRREDAFYAKYIEGMNLANPTEKQLRAFSIGLMQVMGQVAREHGFTGSSLLELTSPDVGVDIGCRKLKACFEAHPDSPEAALLEYNGGANVLYGKQVLSKSWKYQPASTEGAD